MKPNTPFETLITRGGDDRIHLLENGLNKYNVRPDVYQNLFNRASCTCSPFTVEGYEAASALYTKLDDKEFDRTRLWQTQKIKSLINYRNCDRFDVFFAPSGSDLCYYPLLFSRLLNPKLPIFNIVTCPEELGSGSTYAFDGKFYAKENQFGDSTTPGQPIGEGFDIHQAKFSARDINGKIIDHENELVESIHSRYLSHSVLANLVIGSKSGIENNVTIISHTPEDILWSVDLCQFRASRSLINGLIGMNCCVMLTGSKFYQSPPFCAAMLVPKTISRRLLSADPTAAKSFSKVFSRYDIPAEFDGIRQHLKDYRNYGLLLRWEAAITEMELISNYDTYDVNKCIGQWNEFVSQRLEKSGSFQLMPGEGETSKTIISFRVKNSEGEFLSHEELTQLYRTICSIENDRLVNAKRVLFGQPVKYGERSFIRLAIGSSNIRSFLEHGCNFQNDETLISMIEDHAGSLVENV